MDWQSFLAYYMERPQTKIDRFEDWCLLCDGVERLFLPELPSLEYEEKTVYNVGVDVFKDGINKGRIAMYCIFVKRMIQKHGRKMEILTEASQILHIYSNQWMKRDSSSLFKWIPMALGITALFILFQNL